MLENSSRYPLKITICGIDELCEHAGARVTHVLSILDPPEPEPAIFADFGDHERLELRFHDVIEENHFGYTPPERHHVERLLSFGRDMMRDERSDVHLLVHCHAGISRSTAAAVLLLAAAAPHQPPADVMAEVARIRAKAWPNLRMIEFGDALLERKGEIVRAVRARHRQLAANLPEVAEFMRNSGRGRELD